MKFDLLAFTFPPTTVFNQCRKKDLLIADLYHVTVSRNATKQLIKEELYNELVSTGILPAESPLEVSEGNLVVGEASAFPLPTESRLDLVTAIKLKELDLELKRQEHDIKVVQLRTVEVEAHRDITA